MGIERPKNHLAVIRSWATSTLILSKKEIGEEEIRIIKDFCDKRNFDTVYFPGIKEEEANTNHVLEESYYYQEIRQLVDSFEEENLKDFYDSYFFNVSAVTDNQPYFFYTLKWENIPKIIKSTANWQPLIEWGNLIIFATFLLFCLFGFRVYAFRNLFYPEIYTISDQSCLFYFYYHLLLFILFWSGELLFKKN
jgi:hypothetical protein